MIKILSIFPLLCLVSVNYIIVLEIIENRKPELIIAILLGSLGSHFIFKETENGINCIIEKNLRNDKIRI